MNIVANLVGGTAILAILLIVVDTFALVARMVEQAYSHLYEGNPSRLPNGILWIMLAYVAILLVLLVLIVTDWKILDSVTALILCAIGFFGYSLLRRIILVTE